MSDAQAQLVPEVANGSTVLERALVAEARAKAQRVLNQQLAQQPQKSQSRPGSRRGRGGGSSPASSPGGEGGGVRSRPGSAAASRLLPPNLGLVGGLDGSSVEQLQQQQSQAGSGAGALDALDERKRRLLEELAVVEQQHEVCV